MNYSALIAKVGKYTTVKQNTHDYRKQWQEGKRQMLVDTLQGIIDNTDLEAEIDVRDDIENLEVVMFNLGRTKSGIREKLDGDESRSVVRNNGILVYQQLFNGKMVVMIVNPFLEGYGEPAPPKTLEILRPEELNEGFVLRHMEEFLKAITAWEDYDDDQPSPPPIGFNTKLHLTADEA
ncbi:hypothetical protein N9B82_03040 [Saprospiraceae bacterium]|nr:hypothetical protein [Saprospiraceae bacterium]